MTPISEIIFSGFVSKVVNDLVDVSKDKIRKAVENRAAKHQNMESQIYNVIVDVLNQTTGNQYEDNQDKIFDAAYALLKLFKENKGDNLGNIQSCLRIFDLNADENECLEFKISLYEKLGRDEYSELFRAILLLLLEQKNQYDYIVYEQLNQKLDEVILILNQKKDDDKSNNTKKKIKSRTQEYADKWNENMFLNNFDEWDEKAGVNVKLKDVYINAHLPHFVWGENEKESDNLDVLLSKHVMKSNDNMMLLILGQPGIGKSTLITWITVNYADRINDILVYRFASDLRDVDWQNGRMSNRVLEELGLNNNDLNGKILILDGFDEVSIEANRRRHILDSLYIDWINNKNLEKFSLIVTCRENYVPRFEIFKCKYITLQPWDEIQIKSFCNIFEEKTKNDISENTIEKLLENKKILGIPFILYMVLALNISIDKEGSIVDVYDKVFSLEGGIYDRCIDNKMFANKHRIGEIKQQIHQASREIAIWMFENNSARAYIPKEEYQKICANIMQKQEQKNGDIQQDFLIGNYFKLVKHCEGIDTEKLYFVHRSIYEYFVVETIYSSIENAMKKLTVESQEKLAGNIAILLKQGHITNTIGKYLQFKLLKLYNGFDCEKKEKFYEWWEEAIEKMINNGMFYYTEGNIQYNKNIIDKEIKCFLNLN